MPGRPQISVFTPSNTKPEYLEAIFTQREDLLSDAVERVEESARTKNKHHLLFTGPRGCGKTHFVSLLVHRVSQIPDIDQLLQIAWLNEDETTTSLLEFLLQVYEALGRRYPASYPSADIEEAFDGRSPEEAERFVQETLLAKRGDHAFLIITENIDALFEDMKEAGQSDLRALIQENPHFCIVATAQRLVGELTERANPFFGFFQTEHLRRLTVEDAVTLLTKIAVLNKETEVAKFLATARGRSRVRAIHHLSGGNHRVYIVLSQFINSENVDALVEPFAKMVDELTPYYQERIRWLPALQRKIVEFLCGAKRPTPVKAIATRLFKTPPTVSSQLQELREKGYVTDRKRGREVLYEIAEPLMRICVEVKENQNAGPIRLLVDFLRAWYDREELNARLAGIEKGCAARAYFELAAQENGQSGNLRTALLVDDLRDELTGVCSEAIFKKLADIAEQSEELALALAEREKGNLEEAFRMFDHIVCDATDPILRATALIYRGGIYGMRGESDLERVDYDAAIETGGLPADALAWALYSRATWFSSQSEHQSAVADYSSAIDLEGASQDSVVWSLVKRGVIHGRCGRIQEALNDHTIVIEMESVDPSPLASALYNRGISFRILGDREREISDYSEAIKLKSAPPERVAKVLVNRGSAFSDLGDLERALIDYNAAIDLQGAPAEQIANAMINRGVTHGQQGKIDAAIADYSGVFDLDSVSQSTLGNALYYRGITLVIAGDSDKGLKDFLSLVDMTEVAAEQILNASTVAAELLIRDDRWSEGIDLLKTGLERGRTTSPEQSGSILGIVDAIFSIEGDRLQPIRELVGVYLENETGATLGEGLLAHLGDLHRSEDATPISQKLDDWSSTWTEACADIPSMEVPLRIFQTGIDFLKSGGDDRSILLDLNSEERTILEQALGLEDE